MSADPDDTTTEPAADRVADALRSALMRGDLAPGVRLPDTALASEHGVSRNTIREAFRLLRADGLVMHQLNKGVVVRRFDAADVLDMYVVRRTLELRAIEESAFASDTQLALLSDAVAAGEAALAVGDAQAMGTASLEFHRRLVGLLSSPTLDEFFRTVVARLRLAFATGDEAQFQAPWVSRDREINDLIRSGRRDLAGAVMRVYLDDSQAQVIDIVRHQHALSRPRRRGPAAPSKEYS